MDGSISTAKITTLKHIPAGSEARVVSVAGEGRTTRRLMEMGIIPGATVRVIKAAPFGDPIEIRIRGYNLALRKNEADAVTVTHQ